MANATTNSTPVRMVRVIHFLAPSRWAAAGEAVIAVAAILVGAPLPVHVILAIIVDLAVHVARRRSSQRSKSTGRLK